MTDKQAQECREAFEDSELEMIYIDGYLGYPSIDYASSNNPQHINGLRAVAKKVIWGAATKINGELCEQVASLQKEIIALSRQPSVDKERLIKLLEKAEHHTGFYIKSTSEEMLIKAHEAIKEVKSIIRQLPDREPVKDQNIQTKSVCIDSSDQKIQTDECIAEFTKWMNSSVWRLYPTMHNACFEAYSDAWSKKP